MDCSCSCCQELCRVPCWPTPKEVKKLIKLGYGDRLMLDAHVDISPGVLEVIKVVCPARRTCKGSLNTWDSTKCIFQNKKGLCEIHDHKPFEGRIVDSHGYYPRGYRDQVSKYWKGNSGKEVVNVWSTTFLKTQMKISSWANAQGRSWLKLYQGYKIIIT